MGFIVCFEGIDGVGKSTQVILLDAYLNQVGYKTSIIRAPGHTPLGKDLRRMLLDPETYKEPVPMTALFMFLADMVQSLQEEVLPRLHEPDRVFLLDRFWYSTWCYQVATDSPEHKELFLSLCKKVMIPEPDLKIFLYLEPLIAYERRVARGSTDHMESKPLSYFLSVDTNYQELALREGFKTIPVSTIEETHAHVVEHVTSLLLLASTGKGLSNT